MLAKTAPKWPFFGLYRAFFASISKSPPTPLDARKHTHSRLPLDTTNHLCYTNNANNANNSNNANNANNVNHLYHTHKYP